MDSVQHDVRQRQVLLISGGNSGIGRGIALAFGVKGYRVAILGGRIINISSLGAFQGGARRTGPRAYVATKAGLNALTHAWARLLGPEGITVNAIASGFIPTPMGVDWSREELEA